MVKWETAKIKDITDNIVAGGTPSTFVPEYWGGSIPWMNSGELNQKRIHKVVGRITEAGLNNSATSIIPSECILIGLAGQGKTRGTVAINYFPLCTNQSIAAIFPNPRKFVSEYLYQYLETQYAELREISSGDGGRGGLNLRIIGDIEIPLPPLPEQRRIAEVLSDTDELIATLEKLIAKKKAVKQGTMQELLTGKRKLPGFSNEWVERKIGKIAEIVMGQSPNSNFYNTKHDGLPLIQGNADIENRQTIIRYYTSHITKLANRGDIILTVRAPVGNVAKTDFECCLGRGVCAIKGNDYLYQYLMYAEPNWTTLSKGSTFDSINSQELFDVIIKLPEDELEQTAIANILSDMDAEIDALSSKLAKYKNIKYGMMNELLTGRIRLVQPAGNIFKFPEPEELMEHAKLEEEKVIIMTGIVNDFYHPAYPLGRKKVQKLYYMFQRHQHGNILGFKEKAAGPYDEGLRYFIEPLAESNGYIITEENEKGTIFFKGAKIQEALDNKKERGIADSFNWLKDHFLKTSAEKLELLSTVDWALEKLKNKNIRISLTSVKKYIQESEEWKEKLNRELFSDKNIADAIKWSNELFGQENNT